MASAVAAAAIAPAATLRAATISERQREGAVAAVPPAVVSRRLLVIIHGKRVDDDLLRNAIKELVSQGHHICVRVTWDSGDVDTFVREAVVLYHAQAPVPVAGQRPSAIAALWSGAPRPVAATSDTASNASTSGGASAGASTGAGVSAGAGARGRSGGAAAPPPPPLLPYDTIVAGGGDGTLNEVVCAMLKYNAPSSLALALLPLGTANDVACAAGISMDPKQALATALDPSKLHPIDVGTVNGAPFINVATAGRMAAVEANELSSPLKRLLGPIGIGFHVLGRILTGNALAPLHNVTIRYPLDPTGRLEKGQYTTITGDLLLLAAGNARQMGRTVNACPDALLDDGLLSFTLALGDLSSQVSAMLSDVSERGADFASGDIISIKAPWLELACQEPIPVSRDGEPEPASSRLLFSVLPGRLMMHLPDERMLLPKRGESKQLAALRRMRPTRRLRNTLSRMLQPQQPEGGEGRIAAASSALLRKLAWVGALLATGAVLGYLHSQRRQRQGRREPRRARAAVGSAGSGGGGGGAGEGEGERRRGRRGGRGALQASRELARSMTSVVPEPSL